MSIYIIGDYHGTSLQPFIDEEQPSEHDRIFSLGDFDTVDVIKEFLELKDHVGEDNIVEVGANHDYALQEDIKLTSRGVKTPEQLIEEYNQDEEAQKYFNNLLQETNREFEIEDSKGILTHSGLTGQLNNPNMPDRYQEFDYRLWEEEHFKDNFNLMQQNGQDIMIRGHEHYTEHAFRPKNSGSDSVSFHLPEPGDKYKMHPEYHHIITNGAWMDKNYAKINSDEMTIQFKQIS